MSKDRDWRDAKIAQWAKDGIQSEIDQWRLTAALAWPTEAKPAPLPFRWGDYDRVAGDPVPGRYWMSNRHAVVMFDLALSADVSVEKTWKKFAFRLDEPSAKWTNQVVRGPLFDSEHDARLYRRWLMCEDFAHLLMRARG